MADDAHDAADAHAAADPIIAELDGLGVEYEIVPCDPALADTAAFCEAYGYAPEDSANAIVVIGKSTPPTFALCIVLATDRLDVNKAVRKRLGAKKASFADPDDTRRLTGMEIGGVTPLGLGGRIPIWIDANVTTRERVIVGGGSRDRKVLLAPSALAALPAAEVVDGLAAPAAASPGNG